MKKYQSHKVVQAARITGIPDIYREPQQPSYVLMTDHTTPVPVTREWLEKHKPREGWYLVRYEDGYTSASPAKAFEEGYRLIEDSAKDAPEVPPGEEYRAEIVSVPRYDTWESYISFPMSVQRFGEPVERLEIVSREWLQNNRPVVGGTLIKYKNGDLVYQPRESWPDQGLDKLATRNAIDALVHLTCVSGKEIAWIHSRLKDLRNACSVEQAKELAFIEANDAPWDKPLPTKVTKQALEARIVSAVYEIRPDGRTTMCELTMENGATVQGFSVCACKEEFIKEYGERAAYNDALDKAWAFEGYLLKELRFRAGL